MVDLNGDYRYNILAAAAMLLQCQLAGVACGHSRRKYKIDYPDMGCGRYASKLSDKEWVEFNSAIRVHQNYVEQLPIAVGGVLLGGLYFPRFSAALGAVYVVGRFLYAQGYTKFGPKGRMAGAITANLSAIANLVTSFVGIYFAFKNGN
ncbi:Microsomal glutathione S-transferase 3 [Zancudomyces culisetae]|uniref:Microsomal glutathione S-transferase 3 n=1 Tax=Zancudomyces culisetae TaxID=1213189 RepID=A0A1R1PEF2_ZANCU|nr:Microsomal glutathione S-transferase 3 [Zancudomyces culisetae]OMH80339.1 Microsomal glutathione S-transferase 3 [Zancudomyces culisetae]|eukprot:OMH79252.1 Microsomal glutathione S-transferase 3 [Zancudomyces culisetae]